MKERLENAKLEWMMRIELMEETEDRTLTSLLYLFDASYGKVVATRSQPPRLAKHSSFPERSEFYPHTMALCAVPCMGASITVSMIFAHKSDYRLTEPVYRICLAGERGTHNGQ